MKFNLSVNLILAVWSIWYVGRFVATAESVWASTLLFLCIALAVIGAIWRGMSLRQEPAVFAAVSYLVFGALAVAAEAIAGDLTRAVIGGVLMPFLPLVAVEEPSFRRWINRVAGYQSEASPSSSND